MRHLSAIVGVTASVMGDVGHDGSLCSTIAFELVVLNWQRGLAASHDVPIGTASGVWTITGVRAHSIDTDHTGDFLPV